MFHLDDEDDEDFHIRPETSSKLANLFESNEINLDIDSSNKSLKYMAPKQPKKIEIGGNSTNDNKNNTVMTLIIASAVNVFKFENGKYTAQGKLGVALLGNHDTRSYKLILYTGKQHHIAFASIDDNFKLICQPNNYFSFYDNNRQNWSVMFDTEEEKLNFIRQLSVCKFNTIWRTGENESKILIQDLMVGNENSLIIAEDNDNIELRYKGWLFEDNQTLGKLFAKVDGSTKKQFRIKLIGKWTQIVKGMRIGEKRFAVFDPSLKEQLVGILENGPIGQNSSYGFDFELIRIEPRVHQKPEQKQLETRDQNISKASMEEKSSGQRSHSGSLSESSKVEESPTKSKSDILSRVTRMGGLPILPMKSDPKPDLFSDTTDANEDESTQLKPLPKPRNPSIVSQVSDIPTNSSERKFPESFTNCTQFPIQSTASSMSFSPYFSSQSLEANLSYLSAESRSNQLEIRMNLNKIIDKIDSVSDKVNQITNSSSPQMNSMSFSGIGFMDSAILMSSIQRIVTENNTLKKEVEEKASGLQKLNEKVFDLLHMQNTCAQNNNSQELDKLLTSEKRLKAEVIDLKESCDRFRAQTQELSSENSQMKQTVEQLRTDLEAQQNSSREPTGSQSKENSTQIKRLMNDVFRKIISQIDENKSYKSDEIIDIVSTSIRSTTLSLTESRNSSQTNSPFRKSVDEIDKNKDYFNSESETLNKELEKPPIPQRKSIEGQVFKNTPKESTEELDQNVKESQ